MVILTNGVKIKSELGSLKFRCLLVVSFAGSWQEDVSSSGASIFRMSASGSMKSSSVLVFFPTRV